jgi:ubiquinone/menaquinone biosynthesis C-methylase UbiE
MIPRKSYFNLHRTFWSIFGRIVWDAQNQKSRPSETPGRITDILIKRRRRIDECVLDAGCGTGNYSLSLARRGFHVVAMDFSAGMLKKAGEKLPKKHSQNVSFCQADLDAPLEFRESRFDHIIAISVLQAVSDPQFTLDEFRRVLKSKGTLVLSLPKRNSIIMNQSIFKTIRYRSRNLKHKTIPRILFIIIKSLGDRFVSTTRWTPEQSRQMVEKAGHGVISIEERKKILVVAEKK